MRFLHLNPAEFETPDSEETVAFAIAHEKHFVDLGAFYKATGDLPDMDASSGLELPSPSYITNSGHVGRLVSFFESTLRNDARLHVLHDEWNDFDALLKVDHYFARYVWFTTA